MHSPHLALFPRFLSCSNTVRICSVSGRSFRDDSFVSPNASPPMYPYTILIENLIQCSPDYNLSGDRGCEVSLRLTPRFICLRRGFASLIQSPRTMPHDVFTTLLIVARIRISVVDQQAAAKLCWKLLNFKKKKILSIYPLTSLYTISNLYFCVEGGTHFI
jgi:hypothetical protein